MHALGEMWRSEGLRGMYRGMGPTVLSQAPFSALYYMFYTRLQVRALACCLAVPVVRVAGTGGRATGGVASLGCIVCFPGASLLSASQQNTCRPPLPARRTS